MAGRTAQRLREAALSGERSLLAALAALADPVRLRIVLLLREREQCVCHLTAMLGLSQGTISHHMAVLKRAGLVRDRRDPDDSRWTYYTLDEADATLFQEAVHDLLDTSRMDATPASCRDRCN